MRAKAVTADEQYRLVIECRASGLTDYQWRVEHGIKPGTFYNWVKRLRQKGGVDVPSPAQGVKPSRQEIVEIHMGQSPAAVPESGTASDIPADIFQPPVGPPVLEMSILGQPSGSPVGHTRSF